MKKRRFNRKNMRPVMTQLNEWCGAKKQLALSITGQFFHLMIPGYLCRGPKEGGFVFQSPQSAIVSGMALPVFTSFELEQSSGGRTAVTLDREEGRIELLEIDTPEDMLSAIPLSSRLVH